MTTWKELKQIIEKMSSNEQEEEIVIVLSNGRTSGVVSDQAENMFDYENRPSYSPYPPCSPNEIVLVEAD